jgi:hypothetical protein
MPTVITTAKRCKELKCPLAEEWISKIGYVHIMGYYFSHIKG